MPQTAVYLANSDERSECEPGRVKQSMEGELDTKKRTHENNPILDFGIDKASLKYIGHDLQRPECILAEPDGTLWSADARGGVVRIAPDGSQQIDHADAIRRISRTPPAKQRATSRARCRTAWRSPATATS